MRYLALEDFEGMDSFYRLVNICARRANQVSKPEGRALVAVVSKEPVIVAIDDVLEGKVTYRLGEGEEDDYGVG